MNALLRQLKAEALAGMELPGLRFFTPNKYFWLAMEKYKDIMLVDAGCGDGMTTEEGKAKGFNMVGIDLCTRPGQSPNVIMMDSTEFPYNPGAWPMVCRPCHDGFCMDTFMAARSKGAGCIYVGKLDNVEIDVDMELMGSPLTTLAGIGEEGEVLMVWGPVK